MSTGKFGLGDLVEEKRPAGTQENPDLSARLASFPKTTPRVRVDTAEVDAAVEKHGFVSREPQFTVGSSGSRRRRSIPKEDTKAVGFNLPRSDYNRLLAFADKNRVSFQKAVGMLLDIAENGGHL
jgi:hypothetical protein